MNADGGARIISEDDQFMLQCGRAPINADGPRKTSTERTQMRLQCGRVLVNADGRAEGGHSPFVLMQADSEGYIDGASRYQIELGNTLSWLDPSGLDGVGHHYVNSATRKAVESLLSDEAEEFLRNTTTGPFPKDIPHNFGEYGGVSHYDYNVIVKDITDKFIKDNVIE